MKRENFTISWDGNTETAHAWNSANRKMESIVREIARKENTLYYLIAKSSVKAPNMVDTIKGTRTWESKTGKKSFST